MKKISLFVITILLVGLIWYMFKPYDYLVTIKSKASIGTINQSIKSWSSSLGNSRINSQESLNKLSQSVDFNDTVFFFNWKIRTFKDSLSKIDIRVKDNNNSFLNKIKIPFSNTDFEKRVNNTLIEFNNRLENHLQNFKIKVIGETELESTYCAYVPLKLTQIEKAKGMMYNYSLLSDFIAKNNIQLNGKPTVEITYWNIENDSILYNFCYPIIKTDSLPIHDVIKYKELSSIKAIKAIYNGNYITSDRAWYELLDYAEKSNLKVNNTPREIFHNNPNMGGDELTWKAEIYMPIQ